MKSIINKNYFLIISQLIATSTLIYSANAVSDDVFVTEGSITSLYLYEADGQTFINNGAFQAIVTYDPESALSSSNSGCDTRRCFEVNNWNDSILNVELSIYDENNVLIVQDNIDFESNGNSGDDSSNTSQQWTDWGIGTLTSRDRYSETWELKNYDNLDGDSWREIRRNALTSFIYKPTNPALHLDELGNYPDPFNNLDANSQTVRIFNQQDDGRFTEKSGYNFSGTITDLYGVSFDADGDGIADDEDACPNTDLSLLTVSIEDVDTGVNNYLMDNGCTIVDTINDLRDSNELHGEVVSEVSHLLNGLKTNGIITGREKGKIQSTTAKTKSNKKSKS